MQWVRLPVSCQNRWTPKFRPADYSSCPFLREWLLNSSRFSARIIGFEGKWRSGLETNRKLSYWNQASFAYLSCAHQFQGWTQCVAGASFLFDLLSSKPIRCFSQCRILCHISWPLIWSWCARLTTFWWSNLWGRWSYSRISCRSCLLASLRLLCGIPYFIGPKGYLFFRRNSHSLKSNIQSS